MTSSHHDVELANAFVFLADSSRAGHDVVDTMDILVQASVRFTSATEAGILLADSAGLLHVVASTNERASAVEEAQLGFDEGPCIDCIRLGQPVEISDLSEATERWPRFVALTQSRGGFNAVYASPLRLGSHTVGAMNLFMATPDTFTSKDAAMASALTQVATISLMQHQTIRNQGAVNDQLRRALDSRILIEQAKGVLAQRHGVPIDAAFTLLRAEARATNSKLHDIADRVVREGLTLTGPIDIRVSSVDQKLKTG